MSRTGGTVSVRVSARTTSTRSPNSARTWASSPHSGGGWAPGGGGGAYGFMVANIWPMKPGRRPGDQPDRAAGPADPDQLVRGGLVVRREHDADAGEHRCRTRRRAYGSASASPTSQVELDPGLAGQPLADRQQLGGEVGGDTVRAGRGGRDGDVAGAGGDVEHPVAGLDAGGLDQDGAEIGDELGRHRGVVAEGPHGPVLGFQGAIGFAEIGRSCRASGVGHDR